MAKCVRSRREFIKYGYDDCDVYDIHHLTKKQLGYALDFAKQSTEGSKKELRDRLLLFRKITVVPSDVDTDCDTEEESDENTLSDYVPVSSSNSSDSDSSSSSGNSDDEDVTIDNYLTKKQKNKNNPNLQVLLLLQLLLPMAILCDEARGKMCSSFHANHMFKKLILTMRMMRMMRMMTTDRLPKKN